METLADTTTETEVVPEASQEVESEAQQSEEVTLYAGKYRSAEDLEKGYKEMQSLYNSRYKGFTGAPEDGYKAQAIEGVDQSDIDAVIESPIFKKFQERGLERGMSNEFFNEIVNDYISTNNEQLSLARQHELSKLGENAQQRIQNVVDKLGTMLEGDKLEGLKNVLSTADSIEALEILLNKDTNVIAPPESSVDTADKEAELQDLWTAVDDKGRRKMEYDSSYRAMVNKKFKEFYGD